MGEGMEFLPKEPYKKIFYVILYIITIAVCAYFVFEYIFGAALPFLISFFIAYSVQKYAAILEKRTGLGKRTFSLFLGLLLLSTVAALIFLFVSKLWQELYSFVKGADFLREDIIGISERISAYADTFLSRFFRDTESVKQSVSELLEDGAMSIISAITTKIPAFMGKVFSAVPKIIFFVAAMFISCIYFCLDFDGVCAFFKRSFSSVRIPFLSRLPKTSIKTMGRYIRASFIIFLLTALELAVGFLMIGAPYAWLVAAVTAFIDMLPFFGSGIVLIPYALISFISGDIKLGTGLLILWGAVSLIRQIIEPKIMGKNLGVHPLVNIAAVYVGYTFFGVVGVVFLPISVVIIKNLFAERVR